VFLLPTGRKKRETGGPAGDADAQVKARRAFFDGGHYDPILAAAAGAVGAVVQRRRGSTAPVVLDAGCGEGAYVRALSASSASLPPSALLVGIDVSKPAIRLAAARAGPASTSRFAVASSFAIPLPDRSVDCVLVAMAPAPPPAELSRVLVPRTGALVIVRPALLHLDGLRRAVYGERARFEEEEGGEEGAHGSLTLLSRERVTFELALPGPAAGALLGMTPYAWSAREGVAGRLIEEGLETRADVWVESFGLV